MAGKSSISLAGSEEEINFSQQSPKTLKMASESFIHALLLFLGLFSQNFPLGTPVACENIRFSSLFTAGDVSHGGTSATQRQKFHTDDLNQCLHVVAESSTAFGISPRPLVQETIRTVSFTFFALLRSFIRISQSF